MATILDTTKCVVYNASYEVIDFTSARRGLLAYLKNKASIVEEHPHHTIETDGKLYPVPTGIRLHRMVNVFRGPAQLTQGNLFLRDDYTCQYCGRSKGQLKPTEQLTREHVHPKDKGGKDVWKNVVTACNKCNNKKSNRLLKDCHDLKLMKEPYVPTVSELRLKKLARHQKRT